MAEDPLSSVVLGAGKVAGILVELVTPADQPPFAVIGIGINANLTADELPPTDRLPATSLLVEGGAEVDRIALLEAIATVLDDAVTLFDAEGFAPFVSPPVAVAPGESKDLGRLALVTGLPESKLRVIAPDVGGGFGGKLNVYAEEALALVLCKRSGRPVKWIETRSENYVATIHGRGTIHDCTLAGTKDGKILGVKFVEIADMGAYFQLLTPGIPELGGWVYMGPYDPKAYWYEFRGVLTNRTPTDAYRGAGRPEATFVLERLVDLFAQRIGMDPAEVRRRNLVPKFLEARPAISGLSVDSGDYATTLQMALDQVKYDERRKEQERRRKAGDTKQLGIGICTYIEMCGLAPSEILGALKYVAGGWDAATIECLPTGKVIVKTAQRIVPDFSAADSNADGSITVPEALRPYMGGLETIG